MLLGEQAPPRVSVAPPPTRANSWEDVSDLSQSFGITLDDWQDLILQSSMGERSDGTWAAKQVGISVPRQNGKSQLIVARALAGALLFGEKKIVISAHAQDTARETFSKFLEQIDESPALAERIEKVMNALNREFIKFKNGATIQFKARTISGTRGFSSDCLLLDEAQILGMPAWVSINSTMSARPNPQIWLLGTPPTPEDNGEVFSSIRNVALKGKSTTLAWLEWAADPKADPALDETRASGNPAWWTRINHEVVQGEYETYPAPRFALDRLGIWRDELALADPVIMPDEWKASGVPSPPPSGARSLGVKFAADGSRVSVAGAIKPETGPIHTELVGAHSGSMNAGTAALVAWVAERWKNYAYIVVDGKSHAGAFVNALLEAGVPKKVIVVPSWPEVATANALLLQAVIGKEVTHLATEGQKALDGSVAGTTKKMRGTEGAWSWQPIAEGDDETPIAAVSLAIWAAKTKKPKTNRAVFV